MSQSNRVGKKLYFVVNAESVVALLTREEAREIKAEDEILVEGYLSNKQREKLQAQIDEIASYEQRTGAEVI